ncbi:LOW QUALITY PROTEIN: toll-like receptor Tollo [Pollicipes pollicipes]|uniref:LOW QUALITY PROTEIN: toll-like receptor Tollo n=1 Tax=Pollicipes pollicipes TaxID=41117 RepID=UPI0018855D54|nr:LOW QUALITY PROTEIN: toll-like receptor Tollo [Pollicipes pollicipes]
MAAPICVWECRLNSSLEEALVRPDYRATELWVLCQHAAPARLAAGLFDKVAAVRRLEIHRCNVSRVENGALGQFVALKHLALGPQTGGLIVSNQSFHHLHKLESLDLGGNHIEYLPSSAFCRLHRLMHLNLSENALVEVELGFGPSNRRKKCGQTLRELDLSANVIRSVRARSFAKHAALQRLFLADNRIERLSEASLVGVGELQLLDISGNRLVTLPDAVLASVGQLRLLRLQRNRLAVLPPPAFAGLEQLVSLNLSDNELTSPGEFAGLLRLLQLDLSRNRLVDLTPGFRELSSLQLLDLSHNQLTRLAVGSIVDLANLAELDLSHNQLGTLVAGALVGLRGLSVLRLDHNRLVALQPEALANCSGVQRLQLAHNSLAHVPTAVRSLSLLHELDLAHNRLLFIDDDAFEGLRSLLTLDLSHNVLSNLSLRAFVPLDRLERLDLSHNRLTTLQGALRRHRQLSELDVASNRLTSLVGVAGHLPGLRRLNASGNALTLFDYALIPPQLRHLDVSRNRLRSLDDMYDRPAPLQLRELDASGNRISRLTRSQLPDSIEVVRLRDNRISAVEPYSFVGKTFLQLVDLSTNEIERLNETSVRLSVERAEFRLAGNPLVCDCHSEWLARPAGQLAVTDLDQILCRLRHRGRPVRRPLAAAWFLCPYTRHCFALCQCCDFDACDCEQTCPGNCTCLHNNIWTTNIIMCSAQRLLTVPSRIPMDATDILLDGNDLETLYDLSFLGRISLKALYLNASNVASVSSRTFQGLTSLRYLHLQDNRLTRLDGEEMLNLTSLRELYLQNNLLQHVNTALFRNLGQLEVLDLSGNRLTQLAVWTLTQPYLVRISLAGNRWRCECSFRFRFRRWLLQSRHKVADADDVVCSGGDVIVLESECRGIRTAADSNVWVYATAGGVCLAGAEPLKALPPPAYDVLVTYDGWDAPLAAQLEDELPQLRLCLLHRDAAATPDAIADAVRASRAVVLLLSDNFLGRAWCRFDFKHAHLTALGAARRPLVLVDVDDVCGAGDLDPELALLARSCPVLSWRDKQLGDRLLQCLRPPVANGWRSRPPPDDYADGPVYASIDDALVRSPSLAPSEKAALAGSPRVNITVNPASEVAADAPPSTRSGGKVQLTPSYFV